jgi:hypothetical protein
MHMHEAALVLIGYVIGTANGAAILRYFGGALDKEWGCRGTDGARGEIVLPPSEHPDAVSLTCRWLLW